MARKLLLLLSALVLSLLALAGCTTNDSGDESNTSNTETSSPEETSNTESETGTDSASPEETSSPESESPGSDATDTSAACDTLSPGSAEQEECEAQGVPGTTLDPDRCGDTTPSPIASGIIEGTFGPFCENAIASTYDTTLVPDGADTTVTINETDADTTVELIVRGFAPNTGYNATLHEDVCGAQPSAAGGEYTDSQSTQSRYLIMNFTTNDGGGATVSVTAPWLLPDDGIGRSLLITSGGNSGGTSTASPDASGQTDTVGCISLER